MPVKKVKGGYRFGTKGKVYKTKTKAKRLWVYTVSSREVK